MKRALLVATGLLAISTATASAGGFVGLALGSQPALTGTVYDNLNYEPVGRSFRVLGGYRFLPLPFGSFSVEGAINGFGVEGGGRGDRNLYQLSAAGRFNLPLANDFEAFGRLGLERTSLSFDDADYDLSGNGFLVGAGFEYRLTALTPVLASSSLFVDYAIHRATLADARNNDVDATSRIWALGFTFGF